MRSLCWAISFTEIYTDRATDVSREHWLLLQRYRLLFKNSESTRFFGFGAHYKFTHSTPPPVAPLLLGSSFRVLRSVPAFSVDMRMAALAYLTNYLLRVAHKYFVLNNVVRNDDHPHRVRSSPSVRSKRTFASSALFVSRRLSVCASTCPEDSASRSRRRFTFTFRSDGDLYSTRSFLGEEFQR